MNIFDLGIQLENMRKENELLLEFVKSFVFEFEVDFMSDGGEIVDNPSVLLLINYQRAKEIINKIQKQ